jgi:hypothetical protein
MRADAKGGRSATATILASILGSGLAGALIAYPLVYYPLAHRHKAKLAGGMNLTLFVLTVPIIGAAQMALGNDTESLMGMTVLFGAPLLTCFIVIGSAFEIRAARAAVPAVNAAPFPLRDSLRRFERPIERLSLLILGIGAILLVVGITGYWLDRGLYLSELKYDLQELFLEDIGYRRAWSRWSARIGIVLVAGGYAGAYHYDRTWGAISRLIRAIAHWVRTGR